ncbi:MAG: orotidine-5'-phosphate decarboxylase [Thermoanaerobaculum sp.]|nr:orotidine-5'-phosphate decarboxylase [Thermoanaerobaculum sp.]MDW7967274.1 orotidine-5'-phosphate decarboxylase [Thermoanaerobaculum sp.]
MNQQKAAEKLVVALDTADRQQGEWLVEQLYGLVAWFKVGLEAFTALGPDFVGWLVERGAKVFLDLKLHDIPNTVEKAARSCAQLGVSMLNVHAAGGAEMMRAALAGAQGGTPAGHTPPLVLAVTVLTSLDDLAWHQLGWRGSVAEAVIRWAELARSTGLAGVVCSPQELSRLRGAFPRPFLLLTPGIRPAGSQVGDQRRWATPQQAVQDGADLLVVGRPITQAPDPRAAAQQVLDAMAGAL